MDYTARTPEQLGTILKSCRTLRRMSQEAAGSRVGIKQTTVSAIETSAASTRVETLYKLLSALELELVIRDKRTACLGSRDKKAEW
ncbi:MAG TPA: helix-turn-helix domain-containing protein [Rudaea sp.]|nr:helix-turn-helix domain-containing protein [Rudaea sp.]